MTPGTEPTSVTGGWGRKDDSWCWCATTGDVQFEAARTGFVTAKLYRGTSWTPSRNALLIKLEPTCVQHTALRQFHVLFSGTPRGIELLSWRLRIASQ